ncbi:inositol polyphosphate multikinase [Anoplolepis gracilipes]|uniref:inositol polyphosphate multikinase n=1 Tax=Anoplolepis gracilipes TaxID=354296 RepID=UPI003B9F25AB
MTTLESDEGHLDKLPHVEWDNTTSGLPGCMFPDGLNPLECQMAGHPFDGHRHTIGMLVCRQTGHILKPATKAILGEREIAFYEYLKNSHDPMIVQLKKFVPRYFGTTELRVFNKRTKFLKLRDITEGMAEPCVMDIKIGRRTWDPLATKEKKATEELKYAESKRAYGFCITGFQVYCLSTGRLKKFDRDYGKKLDAKGVVEALKTFLNIIPERPAYRQLIFELLSFLGRIMLFFRIQRAYRFYSSSLLVAYDARKLRQCCRFDNEDSNDQIDSRVKSTYSPSTSRTSSGTNVSEQPPLIGSVSNTGTKRNWIEAQRSRPLLKRSVSLSGPMPIAREQILNGSGFYSSDFKINRLCRSCPSQFSFPCTNNVTIKDIRNIENKCNWIRVNMIDFTHVFPADDSDLDFNYLEGIENLIKLLSTFVKRVRKREQGNSCATIAQ